MLADRISYFVGWISFYGAWCPLAEFGEFGAIIFECKRHDEFQRTASHDVNGASGPETTRLGAYRKFKIGFNESFVGPFFSISKQCAP